QQWAYPNMSHAIQCLRHVYDKKNIYEKESENNRTNILDRCSYSACGRQLNWILSQNRATNINQEFNHISDIKKMGISDINQEFNHISDIKKIGISDNNKESNYEIQTKKLNTSIDDKEKEKNQ